MKDLFERSRRILIRHRRSGHRCTLQSQSGGAELATHERLVRVEFASLVRVAPAQVGGDERGDERGALQGGTGVEQVGASAPCQEIDQ